MERFGGGAWAGCRSAVRPGRLGAVRTVPQCTPGSLQPLWDTAAHEVSAEKRCVLSRGTKPSTVPHSESACTACSSAGFSGWRSSLRGGSGERGAQVHSGAPRTGRVDPPRAPPPPPASPQTSPPSAESPALPLAPQRRRAGAHVKGRRQPPCGLRRRAASHRRDLSCLREHTTARAKRLPSARAAARVAAPHRQWTTSHAAQRPPFTPPPRLDTLFAALVSCVRATQRRVR